MLSGIRDDNGLNGLEKLRKISQVSLDNAARNELASVGPNLLRNPKLLAAQIENIIEKAVPVYIQPIIEQGMRDGSIRTDYQGSLAKPWSFSPTCGLAGGHPGFTRDDVAQGKVFR